MTRKELGVGEGGGVELSVLLAKRFYSSLPPAYFPIHRIFFYNIRTVKPSQIFLHFEASENNIFLEFRQQNVRKCVQITFDYNDFKGDLQARI